MENKQRALVLAPHTDDGELGCGGTIARFIAEGKEVFYAAFSKCVRSLPSNLPPDTLVNELHGATQSLGIKKSNLSIFDYDVRTFKQFRQEILEDLINLRKKINPDIIFLPNSKDIHQDHQTISEEGLRAFKNETVLGYELPWNNISFDSEAFVTLSESNVLSKINALKAYNSQQHRNYFKEEFIRGWATMRGVQVSTPYAEAFEILRWVI